MINLKQLFCSHIPVLVDKQVLGTHKMNIGESHGSPVEIIVAAVRQETVVHILNCTKCGKVWKHTTRLFP